MDASRVKALQESPASNVPALLVNLFGFALGMASLISGWPTTHWAWTVFAIIWLSYFQHTWMMIFHADIHYALYRGRWHNIRNGIIVGTLLMIPFSVYQFMHLHHHGHANEADDWELWPYCDPSKSLAFRRIFVLFDFLLSPIIGLYVYNRVFFVKNSPIRDPRLRRSIWLQYFLILIFWGSVWGIIAHQGAWLFFAKVYLIPACVTGTIQTVRKLTEHLGLPAGKPMFGARTVIADSLIGRLITYTSLGVPGHGVHHMFPRVPINNLRKAYDLQREENDAAPVFASHISAILDMCRHLLYPGSGANVVVGKE